MKRIFENAGFRAEVANTGGEAFELIEKKKFDVILIDIMLPDMSGWVILKKMKEKKVKSKFAFLSAILVPEDKMDSLKGGGIMDYITKPFDNVDLVKRINAMLSAT